MSNEIEKVGFIEKGTGKHQSNIVYSAGGYSPSICATEYIKCSTMILTLARKVDGRRILVKDKELINGKQGYSNR